MSDDALKAGVYGGLTTKENIKLLICYIINNIDVPLPQNRFCDEMHADGIANYFELAEAFSDLKNKGLIAEADNSQDYYILTDNGRLTINELKTNIPDYIRERAFFLTDKMLKRIKYQEQTDVKVEKLAKGEYYITCSITEDDKVMMSTSLTVPDFETAQKVKNIFWDSPETIYSGILHLLTHENLDFHEKLPEFLDK